MKLGLGLRNLRQIVTAVVSGGASPALKFNVASNSQYIPIVGF